ncbi:MAG: class I SAM-dependent methyltransferase [Hyphomonadaceae bacterium]|nr:class I SAM-dependent methyltransferase [Hyphomonadaceae bacterium]
MTQVFEEAYAAAYDAMYRDKDDAGECDAVMRLVDRHADGPVRRVLDLGCGTGRHAIEFAARGLDVVGVDFSEPMLKRARERAAERKGAGKLQFLQGDARDFSGEAPFDAVMMNFNVFGYMNTNADLRGALTTARRNLRKGGVFVADLWYGPAVLADPPGDRLREIEIEGGRLLRFSSGRHEPDRQRMQITIRVMHIAGGRVLSDSEETHGMRYFFPLELDFALAAHGLKLDALTGFPGVDEPASVRRWMCALAATAV